MNRSRNLVVVTLVVGALLWTFLELQIQANAPRLFDDPDEPSLAGTDVIVGDMPNLARYPSSGDVNGEVAFSVATTSCNIGTERLDWFSNTNQHPVISQNLYRIKDGRLEQLGQSWLKHGFFALSNSLCTPCNDPTNGSQLGVGCSDPYGAGLNGSHSGLGPKSEVNAATGFFLYPPRSLANPSQRGTLDGRIRVKNIDLDPNLNPGARYYVESQYVHPDDAAAGNKNNSVSYREVFVDTNPAPFDVDTRGNTPTVRCRPVMKAWETANPNVQVTNFDVPGDGRIIVGILTTPAGDGGFHTEIAIQNQTSDRCVRSLDVRCSSGSISNEGFNDVDYAYEPYTDTDWAPSINGSNIEWSTQTFAQNQNANALRWGTVYSFWFDSDERPQDLTLGLFKPGTPTELTLDVSGAVLPDSYERTEGLLVSGTVADLADSDDSDLVIKPFGPTTVEFEIKGTSPVENPSVFEVTFEAAVDPIFSNVDQKIELYNYNNDTWVELDKRRAARVDDDVLTVAASGNLSRFVENGTGRVEARITFASTNARRRFVSSSDQFKWTILP